MSINRDSHFLYKSVSYGKLRKFWKIHGPSKIGEKNNDNKRLTTFTRFGEISVLYRHYTFFRCANSGDLATAKIVTVVSDLMEASLCLLSISCNSSGLVRKKGADLVQLN